MSNIPAWHGPRRVSRVFGIKVGSDFPWQAALPPASGEAELHLSCRENAHSPAADEILYQSPVLDSKGRNVVVLARRRTSYLLILAGGGVFRVEPSQIVCYPRQADASLVEMALLGTVLSFWLELQGILAIHASCVTIKGKAVAFLSGNQGGKTALAAAFLRSGSQLLTDDVLPVRLMSGSPLAVPAYPQMRMWPPLARYFIPQWEALPRIHPRLEKRRVPVGPAHFGDFCHHPTPLAAIFLLARGEAELRVRPLGRSQAVWKLACQSFIGRTAESAGLRASRLDALSQIVRRVPVYTLKYPSGLSELPRVEETVKKTLS